MTVGVDWGRGGLRALSPVNQRLLNSYSCQCWGVEQLRFANGLHARINNGPIGSWVV